LNTIRTLSPTTAWISGPRSPKWAQAAGRGFRVVNDASVYSRYSDLTYVVPIRSDPRAVNVASVVVHGLPVMSSTPSGA
jgi:hypothetical protein